MDFLNTLISHDDIISNAFIIINIFVNILVYVLANSVFKKCIKKKYFDTVIQNKETFMNLYKSGAIRRFLNNEAVLDTKEILECLRSGFVCIAIGFLMSLTAAYLLIPTELIKDVIIFIIALSFGVVALFILHCTFYKRYRLEVSIYEIYASAKLFKFCEPDHNELEIEDMQHKAELNNSQKIHLVIDKILLTGVVVVIIAMVAQLLINASTYYGFLLKECIFICAIFYLLLKIQQQQTIVVELAHTKSVYLKKNYIDKLYNAKVNLLQFLTVSILCFALNFLIKGNLILVYIGIIFLAIFFSTICVSHMLTLINMIFDFILFLQKQPTDHLKFFSDLPSNKIKHFLQNTILKWKFSVHMIQKAHKISTDFFRVFLMNMNRIFCCFAFCCFGVFLIIISKFVDVLINIEHWFVTVGCNVAFVSFICIVYFLLTIIFKHRLEFYEREARQQETGVKSTSNFFDALEILNTGSLLTQNIETFYPLISMLTKLVFVVASIFVLLTINDLQQYISMFIASLGIFGAAWAFAAKEVLASFINGVLLFVEHELLIGDYVTICGISGYIEKLSIHAIHIREVNGSSHMIPYSKINILTNQSREYTLNTYKLQLNHFHNVEQISKLILDVSTQIESEPEYKKTILKPLNILGINDIDLASGSSSLVCVIKTTPDPFNRYGFTFFARLRQAFIDNNIQLPNAYTSVVNYDADLNLSKRNDVCNFSTGVGCKDKE